MQQPDHPDTFLKELLAKGGRPLKRRNLQALHDICRTQHAAGSRDFSVSSIGKLCEQAGLLKARGLYNAPLADYRLLIGAWEKYVGPPLPKPQKQLATEAYLSRIEDPAIRALVQAVIVERNKLKAQLNTLKARTTAVVDRRPPAVSLKPGLTSALTHSEQKALEKSISPEFLEAQGWTEVEFGEVVNTRGHTVLDPGYATGMRKILEGIK